MAGFPKYFNLAMKIAYICREDILEKFSVLPLNKYDSFLSFWVNHAARDYPEHFCAGKKLKKYLSQTCKKINYNGIFPFTRLMYLVWVYREDVQKIAPLQSEKDFAWFYQWFYICAVRELNLYSFISEKESQILVAPAQGLEQKQGAVITNLMYLFWSYNETARQYDLKDPRQRQAFVQWYDNTICPQYGFEQLLETQKRHPVPVTEQHLEKNILGVNIIGPGMGDLGIGEDVRMMVAALKLTNIPFCVINYQLDKSVSQTDQSICEFISPEPRYCINIFCMPGLETASLWLTRPQIFKKASYNIGYWPWELSKWPKPWHVACQLVDEIWASSRYTQKAYAKAKIPVKRMPMTVSVEYISREYSRADYQLPERHKLFLFAFDFLSYPHRKNPFACIDAFIRAFPPAYTDVNLVLKISNLQRGDKLWNEISLYAQKDKRIILITETMSRGKLLRLFELCDAYVSLHRAEGFGRTMAEALLLGKPVIATDYSGNTDFISTENAYPVACKQVKVAPYAYIGWQHQHWADADINDAARQFRNVYLALSKSRAQKKIVLHKRYQPQICAKRYQKRLKKIHQNFVCQTG